MSYPFSVHRGSINTTSKQFYLFKIQFRDHLLDGKLTVSLLEAPIITCKPPWKLYSFMCCRAKLCPKYSTHFSVLIIFVIGQHFNVSAHVATVQAERCVEKFKRGFGELDKLSLLGYFNSSGVNITKQVRLTWRPKDLSYIMVEARIPLASLHAAFPVEDVYNQ